MTVSIELAELSHHDTGFALNATEWNSKLTELDVIFQNGSKDVFFRQIVIEMTTGENINAGDAVRISGTTVIKCDNTTSAGISNFIGVALETVSVGNSVKITTNRVECLSDLVAGNIFYIGESGTLTSELPTTNFVKAVGVSLSSTVIHFTSSAEETENISQAIINGSLNIGNEAYISFQDQSIEAWRVGLNSSNGNYEWLSIGSENNNVMTLTNEGKVVIGRDEASAFFHVDAAKSGNEGLAEQQGQTVDIAILQSYNGNSTRLKVFEHRFEDGNSWLSASSKIQMETDSTSQASIVFNPENYSYGLSLNTRGSQLGASHEDVLPSLILNYHGHILPGSDGEQDLGEKNYRYKTLYLNEISLGNAIIKDAGSTTSSIEITTGDGDDAETTLGFVLDTSGSTNSDNNEECYFHLVTPTYNGTGYTYGQGFVMALSEQAGKAWIGTSNQSDGYEYGSIVFDQETGDTEFYRKLIYNKTELTISEGEITVNGPLHTIDTETDSSTDDLDTINGGVDNERIILSPANGSRTIVVKHGTGNIYFTDESDYTMDTANHTLELIKIGNHWKKIGGSN